MKRPVYCYDHAGRFIIVPYGDDWIIANRVCLCRHLVNEHGDPGPCEACACVKFRPGGDRVEP